MTDDTPTQSSDRLDQIIAEYLAAEESGTAPSRENVLAANPDLADELQRFFTNREELAVALPGEPPRKRFVPPKVRYFGDYELLDEIARGGMGVVYRAKQTSLNRIVAIKMILEGNLAGEEDVKRFRTEAEAAANLKHPGIVPVHEVGVHEGHHYFSMDYIEGRSLAEIVRENPLPARKAAEYVRSIAEAVHYAHNHQQGTLHRDLKPSNILIDGADYVHVTDFGLAVRVEGDSELTRTGQILGTPAYMPPEQAQGKRALIGPTSDIYALGAILYELLTGRPPFRGESAIETLKLVIESEPVSPRLLNPKVPRDLETICLKCLQKEPHKRYLTAEELSDELGRFLVGEPIRARPVGRIERAWRWCRRNPAASGLLGTVTALILAIAVISPIVAATQRRLRGKAEALASELGESLGVQKRLTNQLERAFADLSESSNKLRDSLEREQDSNYHTQILLAHREVLDSNLERADEVLEECAPELRGWEWSYLKRLANPIEEFLVSEKTATVAGKILITDKHRQMLVRGHDPAQVNVVDCESGATLSSIKVEHVQSIDAAAFSGDGRFVAIAGESETTDEKPQLSALFVWDLETEQMVFVRDGMEGRFKDLDFRSDGRVLAASIAHLNVSRSGTIVYEPNSGSVRLIDAQNGDVLHESPRGFRPTGFARFSPDDQYIVWDGGKNPEVWTADGTKRIFELRGHSDVVRSICFHPDGEYLVSAGSDRLIKVWSLQDGMEVRTLSGHAGAVNDLAISPNGVWVVSVGDDRTVRIWSLDDGAINRVIRSRTARTAVEFGEDSETLFAADQTYLFRTHVSRNNSSITLSGFEQIQCAGAFSPDSALFATPVGGPRQCARIWNVATRQVVHTLPTEGITFSVVFSPDGKHLAVAESGGATLWDVTAETVVARLQPEGWASAYRVSFSADGKSLALAGDKGASVWSIEDGRMRASFPADEPLDSHPYVWCSSAVLTEDQSFLLTAGHSGVTKIRALATGEEIVRINGAARNHTALFSPDEREIAVTEEELVRVFNAQTGMFLHDLRGHTEDVHTVAYSRDGLRLVTASRDGTVRIWDRKYGQVKWTPKTGQPNKVGFVAEWPGSGGPEDEQEASHIGAGPEGQGGPGGRSW